MRQYRWVQRERRRCGSRRWRLEGEEGQREYLKRRAPKLTIVGAALDKLLLGGIESGKKVAIGLLDNVRVLSVSIDRLGVQANVEGSMPLGGADVFLVSGAVRKRPVTIGEERN